ncbi:MAG TPA: rod shape-determining protein MreC [Candidatus Angelobacter sp.]|nr:rod shape-determining protein MreC [Candidatus Angelobacter sp.]
MENFFARYKNPLVLMAVLFIQVIALATQVKRPEGGRASGGGGTRLIRVWTITAFTPIEKLFISTGHFFRNSWHNYADLRGVRKQNEQLQQEIERLRLEQVKLRQDADQARRLQALLEFRQKFVDKTVTAQVIATSGTEQSQVILIDKGSRDHIAADMAVITPDGIVGKVKEVFPLSSQVLLINDHDSGTGVILEGSRLQGVLKGTSLGELQVTYIMSDEKVEAGEHVITSGGDRIYPKGLSVGTVTSASPDRDSDPFLSIKVKPAADLRRLEEVLVITKMTEETPVVASGTNSLRAADILSQRLPSIPKTDPNAPKTTAPGAPTPERTNPARTGGPGAAASPSPTPKPAGGTASPTATPKTEQKKEATAGAGVKPASGATEGAAGKTPALTTKPAANGGAPQAQPSPARPAKQAAKPAGSTGQSSISGTAVSGSPTPTPTPKPKASAPKKTKSSTPADASQPNATGSEPAATPTPSPEKPPR